jgi:hypothetical protein
VNIVHALRKIADTDDRIIVLPQHINNNLTANLQTCVFQAGITVVAVGNDLHQRAHDILADRLVCLLQGNPVSVL